jgi:hypothetical protein
VKFIAPTLILKWEQARRLNPSKEEEEKEEEIQRLEDTNYPFQSQMTVFPTLKGYKCMLQWYNCPLFRKTGTTAKCVFDL